MPDKDNQYTKMQRDFYESTADNMVRQGDHRHHDENPDYYGILLSSQVKFPSIWCGKKALDLGCGTGRNVSNMAKLCKWERVDGVDISKNNLDHADRLLKEAGVNNFRLFQNNGVDLDVLEPDTYDFIMSTIVLQHIAVHEIRYSLLKGVYRALKRGGLFSFQMGYGDGYGKADYYENAYHAQSTNSDFDVTVNDPDQVLSDLKDIGFGSATWDIRPAFSDGHPKWIFFKAFK